MKKWLSSLALSLGLLASSPAEADDADHRPSYAHNDNPIMEEQAAVMGANVALGGIVGCIGAEISGDGCLEGLWRGSLGGFVTYAGMEIGSHNAKVPFTGLIGRGIVDLGSSIISNAAYSREFLERFETSFGPVLFSIDRNEGLNVYLQPVSAGAVAYHLLAGHSIALENSLQDGNISFNLPHRIALGSDKIYSGYTLSNIPAYIRNNDEIRSHENMHTYQSFRFRWVDELMPEVWRFRYGAEAAELLIISPATLFPETTYEYNPLEVEAYIMERL